VKRRARGVSLEQAAINLEKSRDALKPRIMSASDTPGNREALNHWIGIERWSQNRLRVAQGAPFVEDSYRGYRMAEGTSLEDLQAQFFAVRGDSIAKAHELARAGVDPSLTIKHNDLGELTVVEWLTYMEDHPRREIIRLRGR
jgi:hypothetical protein